VALALGLDPNLSFNTNDWFAGSKQVDLKGHDNYNLAPGTPIATFNSGVHYSGEHAGIFLGYGIENSQAGFFMLDQYVDQASLTPHCQNAEVRFHYFNTDAKSYFNIV